MRVGRVTYRKLGKGGLHRASSCARSCARSDTGARTSARTSARTPSGTGCCCGERGGLALEGGSRDNR